MAQAWTWTKGKQGDWLVSGEPGHAGSTVSVTKKSGGSSVVTLDKQIWSGNGRALYTVAPREQHYSYEKYNGPGRKRGGYVRSCPTDGNCSSFGSGKSCGAEDCDGW